MMSLRTHNIMDYVGGALLILAPFIFGFADVDAARNVMMLTGFTLILYSLFTNYEFAVVRAIPLGVHMTMDVLAGVVLLVAPWVFNYRALLTPGQEYLHYIIGIGLFAVVGLTEEKTEEDKHRLGGPRRGIRVGTSTTASGRV